MHSIHNDQLTLHEYHGQQRSRKLSTHRSFAKRRLHVEGLEDRRLLTGDLDLTFSGDGLVTTAFPNGSGSLAEGRAMLIQDDGKIVVAGYASNGTNDDFAVARYNTDGSLDNSFDGDGKVTTAVGTARDVAESIALQSDGKIIVAGFTRNGSSDQFAVVRYNTDGTLDTSFDGDGKLVGVSGGDRTKCCCAERWQDRGRWLQRNRLCPRAFQ
jgi:uncharacterized delta-60 repeat protein